ncbi:PQQ-like beta-propeller repeat protein, partial [Bacteroidales bacterium OttesenSCG-928-A14]|nr:PQQ-like beta-propeller repeat protein [Bacteroidales bacterium OttesenSCG-928-A14]
KIRIIHFFFLLFPIIAVAGCRKQVDPVEIPQFSGDTLKIVWQTKFYNDPEHLSPETPILWGDYLIIGDTDSKRLGKHDPGIKVVHKLTGKNHPAWDKEPGGIVLKDHNYINHFGLCGNNNEMLFGSSMKTLYMIDLNSGSVAWRESKNNEIYGHIFSNFMGKPVGEYTISNDINRPNLEHLVAWDCYTREKRVLCSVEPEDGYAHSLGSPAVTKNAEGDTLILFLETEWHFDLSKGRFAAYCYNVTKQKLEWRHKGFTSTAEATYYIPVITDCGKVVFQGMGSVSCFDIASGELLWLREPLTLHTGFVMSQGNHVFVWDYKGAIYCIDANTGVSVWENRDSNIGPYLFTDMAIYKERLYFIGSLPGVSSGLFCLSAKTGEQLWMNDAHYPFGGVAIDQETGYLYFMSKLNLITCIDLNDY